MIPPSQALSVDPINGHILELLNLALDSSLAVSKSREDLFRSSVAMLNEKAARMAKATQVKDRSAIEAGPSGARDTDAMSMG